MSRRYCCFILWLLFFEPLWAHNGVPQLVPFQGRLTEPNGVPINYSVTVRYRIYPPSGICYLYEDTQNVTPNAFGVFSVLIGASGNSTGPANNFAQIFNNDSVGLSDSCSGVYVPLANDWRRIEVLVNGVPFTDMQTVGTAPFSFNSNMLEGKRASDFIIKDSTVTQSAVTSLLNGSDASSLHNHDTQYAKLDGSNSYTGNISTSGSIGVGTSSASADVDIQKNSPRLRLGATTGGGGTSSIEFFSGASTQRARIESSENQNILKFYTGTSEAMSLDANKNLYVGGSLRVTGTVGVGAYTAAQDTTLVGQLAAMGSSATGSMWIESTSGKLRYWDGAAAKTLLSNGTAVLSITAGTGLNKTGTATDPILEVKYGSTSGTAIEGNASVGGDVSGTYTAITVNRIHGKLVDETGIGANKIMKYDGTKWVMSDDSGWLASDASYVGKGIVQFDTNATTSGINVASGVASVNTGTGANQIVKLDATSKLPAVDGSQLTAILATDILSLATTGIVQRNGAGSYSTVTVNGPLTYAAGALSVSVGTASGTLAAGDDSRITGALQKSGGTMSGALNMGSQDITNAGHIAMSANKTLALSSNAADPGSPTAGQVWYNSVSNTIKYYDGTSVKALGVAGSGVQTFNGQTGNTQSLANNLTGTTPAWSSAGNTHTLNIPMASGAGVTAGLLNKTDYDAFTAKLGTSTSFSGDISGVYNSTTVDKIKGKAVTAPTTAGEYMIYDGTAWSNVSMSGDATMNSAGVVTIKNTGTAGTYSKVTTDAQGRVTSATNIGSSDVTTALGFTPMNKAGDSMSGALMLNAENEIRFADGDSSNYVGFKAPTIVAANKIWTLPAGDGTAGQILKTDGAGNLSWVTDAIGAAPGDASYAAKGVVQFDTNAATSGMNVTTGVVSVNTGTSANQIVKLDGTSKLPAVDGSQLTNLNASNLSSGTLPTARLPALTGDVTTTAGSNSVTLNTVTIAKGGTGQTTQIAAFNALSPLTTKGDVIVHDGTNNIRLGVGADGKALIADSAQASGIKWADILATDILSLATTGIVQRNGAGSYSTVTVNAPLTYAAGALGASVGTTAGTLAAGDDSRITGALQKTGGTMSGAINMGSQDISSAGNITMASSKILGLSNNSSDPGSPSAGQIWYNSTGNVIKYYDGASVKTLGVAGAGVQSLNSATGNAQTMVVTSTGSDVTISRTGDQHEFNIPSASAANRGVLTSTDWTTFNNKLGTALNSAKIWVGNGSNVATAVSMSGDVTIDNAGVATIGAGTVTSSKILDGTIVGADISSSAALSVASVSTSGNASIGGTLTVTSSISGPSFNYTSDRRLKKDIVTMTGLETILRLRGVRFNWIKDGRPEVGLIAQEVEKVVPELVIENPQTGLKAVKYGNIVAPLIESTKELYGLCQENRQATQGVVREVASLHGQVDELKRENESLRKEIQEIKRMLKAHGE